MAADDRENRIDYIEIPVKEVPCAQQFYQTVFGWSFEDYGPGYSSFFDGRLGGGLTTEREPPARGTLVVIYVRDLRAAEERVRAAGGSIIREAFAFPGGRRFHFTDPDGNELSVWSDHE